MLQKKGLVCLFIKLYQRTVKSKHPSQQTVVHKYFFCALQTHLKENKQAHSFSRASLPENYPHLETDNIMPAEK